MRRRRKTAVGRSPECPKALDEVARELMTENSDGTYSIRIPSESDRVITVPEHGNARIIAKAEALRMKLSAR